MIAVLVGMLLGAPAPSLSLLVDSSTCTDAELEAIVAGERELPALAEVQAVARAAWSAHRGDPGWLARARWRGLVPRIDVSVGTDNDLDVRDTIEARTTVEGRALGLRVGARFELGDLVFSETELRASRDLAAREDELRALLVEVTTLYFQRVEVLLAVRAEPTPALRLRAHALDGLLRALTDGRLEPRRPRSR